MLTFILGTRGSQLALAQTRSVIALLESKIDADFELQVIKTAGDMEEMGEFTVGEPPGIFTRAIESELLAGRIDIAVHSLKDLPLAQPAGLTIAAVPPRAEPREMLVIAAGSYSPGRMPLALESSAVVGTSSPRRRAQIIDLRADIKAKPLRGNLPTRLQKVRAGEYDAALVAAAGLERLTIDRTGLNYLLLDPRLFTPAPGQGALALEMRCDDPRLAIIRSAVNDSATEICVLAERRLLA
ncbi:MAG: hydroxymethylbilane synthase, partial [Calditrichaeota bacterium]|nr:hydroxymethylbilane synthase [Calditrichota bacterium]